MVTNLQLASFGDDMANNTTRLFYCQLSVHVLREESLRTKVEQPLKQSIMLL